MGNKEKSQEAPHKSLGFYPKPEGDYDSFAHLISGIFEEQPDEYGVVGARIKIAPERISNLLWKMCLNCMRLCIETKKHLETLNTNRQSVFKSL